MLIDHIQLTMAETNTQVSVSTRAIVAVQTPVFPEAPFTLVYLPSGDALKVLEPRDYILEHLPTEISSDLRKGL